MFAHRPPCHAITQAVMHFDLLATSAACHGKEIIILQCVWLQFKKLAYFTIQFIFDIIHGSYCTF